MTEEGEKKLRSAVRELMLNWIKTDGPRWAALNGHDRIALNQLKDDLADGWAGEIPARWGGSGRETDPFMYRAALDEINKVLLEKQLGSEP